MVAVYKVLIKSGKVLAVGLIKPGVYWRLSKVGVRPISPARAAGDNGGYKIPMVQFLYQPNFFWFRLILFFLMLKKEQKMSQHLLPLIKQTANNECCSLFKQITDDDLCYEKIKEPLFLGVSKKSVNQFFANSVIVDCQKGDRVKSKGVKADRCNYFILSGFIMVCNDGQLIEKITAGDCFGEIDNLFKQSEDTACADFIAGCDGMKIGIVSVNALNNITSREDFNKIRRNFSMTLSKRNIIWRRSNG